MKIVVVSCLTAFAFATPSHAQSPAPSPKLDFEIMSVTTDNKFSKIGNVSASDTQQGLELSMIVTGLTAGDHGIHIHQNGSCAAAMKDGSLAAAESAGSHYDPDLAKTHAGPNVTGHRGDLPKFSVAASTGETKVTLLAPRLKVADVAGRSLVIHEGGDNYSDQPELGGGGKRIACGVIPRL